VVWTALDGGRMATHTHIPVRSARRCILRSAAAKFAFTTAVAISTTIALAYVGAIKGGPEAASATSPKAALKQAAAYGWPVKPFDRPHPVRANFADPRSTFLGSPTMRGLMKGRCFCSYHAGIDISVPDGTAVYPVKSGKVRLVTREWVEVDSGGGVAFQYWHITPLVRVGDSVSEDKTVLGHTFKGFKHVHLSELQNGRLVNPLAPGHIGPYADATAPKVGAITFRASDTGPELLPEYLHGRVEIVAAAADMPAMRVPGQWSGLPVTPARLTFHVVHLPDRKTVISETTALDVRNTLPGNARNMWLTYARGTRQNFVPMGAHRYWLQPGVYLFKIAPSFDTRRLKDGAYELTVTASDTRGNHGSGSQIFSVHNRSTWLQG
jgi:murein DD-endopeptidase MepM/ murein hydrolase activator NlpD